MKLAQFKTTDSNRQRLGVLLGDVVCDVAELADAVKASGAGPPSWLLKVNSCLDVISRGASALREIDELLRDGPSLSGRGAVTAFSLDSIEFLPAVYPSKILAIGRNYADHAAEGGADLPKAPAAQASPKASAECRPRHRGS